MHRPIKYRPVKIAPTEMKGDCIATMKQTSMQRMYIRKEKSIWSDDILFRIDEQERSRISHGTWNENCSIETVSYPEICFREVDWN